MQKMEKPKLDLRTRARLGLNRLGLTIKDYKCPSCGWIHARSFMAGKLIHKYRGCSKQILQALQ